ncbi:hypothetical protein OKJ48_28480 [Streptomyces kunmingensis]|uniref:DUF3592 domain-containing protein n=1 Tax=Streptomyces kunmingensis TaxID=68225 RepID=A0ABU6CHF9_9ACTN|nr:hypothetical protein [Streptomyces kunmingensis]MEB3964147.1 hypothetical protein [Streptomyces kunmingensis]
MTDVPDVPDGAGRAGGKKPGGQERRTRLLGRIGTSLVLIGLVLFALVPFAEADNRAYEAAPTCPAGQRADGCRAVLPATVVDKDTDTGGKSVKYYLYLRETGGPAGGVHRVRLPDDEPVYDHVHRGDRVTATYWGDEIREVRAASGTQRAALSPVHDGRLPGTFAVVALAAGLGLLWFWWWMRYRPAPTGTKPSWKPGVGLVWGVLVVGCALPVMLLGADDIAAGLRFAAVAALVCVPLSVLLCWWGMRRVRRGVAKLVPVAPTGRRVLGAVVHGDVPYSRPGYSYLVVGDGPPVATPDPTGHVALAPLPASLTVRGVREPVVGDPPFALGGRGEYTVVIECEDDEREVLVFVGRKHAPRVLGALLPAGATRPVPTRRTTG